LKFHRHRVKILSKSVIWWPGEGTTTFLHHAAILAIMTDLQALMSIVPMAALETRGYPTGRRGNVMLLNQRVSFGWIELHRRLERGLV
jgi:hypothetical protein